MNTVEYCRRRDVAVEILDGEALIWDDRAQALHRLDRSSTRVWEACAQWRTPMAIASCVTATEHQNGGVDDIDTALRALCAVQLLRARELEPERE